MIFNRMNFIAYLKIIMALKVRLRSNFHVLIHSKNSFFTRKYDIVHFITGDKFTAGYIQFMQKYFSTKNHLFITTHSPLENNYNNTSDTIICESFVEAMSRSDILKICKNIETIVWSGIFDKMALLIAPQWLIRKSFLHFWGGDFYCYREPQKGLREQILYFSFLKQCEIARGLIFLIYGEESVFKKICDIRDVSCFVAPMPVKPMKVLDILEKHKKIKKYRIIIGNSATQENNHLDAFNKIKNSRLDNTEISCPLSYGDMSYKEDIKKVGYDFFGSSFRPLEDFMDFDDYIQYLADCDVGIFNNNRQQAMGNINFLLVLGKKVYINKNTSMWAHYRELGCTMFDTDSLLNQSIDEILNISEEVVETNRKAILSYTSDEHSVQQWEKILDSAR